MQRQRSVSQAIESSSKLVGGLTASSNNAAKKLTTIRAGTQYLCRLSAGIHKEAIKTVKSRYARCAPESCLRK